MDVEQTVKDLQAQNAQFQQMLMALTRARGVEDSASQREEEENKETNRSCDHGKKV